MSGDHRNDDARRKIEEARAATDRLALLLSKKRREAESARPAEPRQADQNDYKDWFLKFRKPMVLLTFILMIAQVFQAWFVGCQFRDTKEAYKRGDRAWMAVANIDTDFGDTRIAVKIKTVNTGRTFAKNVRWGAMLHLGDEVKDLKALKEHPSNESYRNKLEINQGTVFPSSEKMVVGEFPMNRSEVLDVVHGRQKLFMIGEIIYDDVFGTKPPCHTRFYLKWSPDAKGWEHMGEHNDAT